MCSFYLTFMLDKFLVSLSFVNADMLTIKCLCLWPMEIFVATEDNQVFNYIDNVATHSD